MSEIMLIAGCQKLPTKLEIVKAMNKKLGYKDAGCLMEAVILPCAEVAEAIMLRQWRQDAEKDPIPENIVVIKRKSRNSKRKCYCAHCQFQSVHPIHNYCPNCGTKIQWIESHEEVVRAPVKKIHPWKKFRFKES